MLKIPKEYIVEQLKEKKGLSDEEINSKIKEKMDQLQGLISEEGAAHIIANEHGINLMEQSDKLQIKNIFAGMRNIEVVGKVTRIFEVRHFETPQRKGKVGSFMIGDETGSIRITAWGDKADVLEKLKEEDIVMIKSGYSRENNGRVEVHLNDNSEVIINPKGEKIGEVKTRIAATRKKINELDSQDQNIEILGTIVQAFDTRFFEVCPKCGKRAREAEEGFACEEHGKVDAPGYSYVMNLILDDGTETIRTIFFRNQLQHLLSKTHEEILEKKDASFEDIKTDLLGHIIKVIGRVATNDMFARIEFVAQIVERDPDPDEEMKRLDEEAKKAADTPAEKEEETTESPAPAEPVKEEVSAADEQSSETTSTSATSAAPIDEEIKPAVPEPEVFEEETKKQEETPKEETVSLNDLEDLSDDDIYE
ncbi:DUF2240 family protein [Candidatus Woesearchaeota archaeon]|nr:DUF2240 family protein [Candidatus Woesearchaeota archaeon]